MEQLVSIIQAKSTGKPRVFLEILDNDFQALHQEEHRIVHGCASVAV